MPMKLIRPSAGRLGGAWKAIDTMKKDLTEMVEEMRSLGWPSFVTQAALNGFAHASQAGLGAKDVTALPVSWSSKPQKL